MLLTVNKAPLSKTYGVEIKDQQLYDNQVKPQNLTIEKKTEGKYKYKKNKQLLK